jgi:peroxiredoxin Q/BCP
MVTEGRAAPQFTLLDQDGTKVKLSELKGTTVVLYFYSKDDTTGCTKEACAFRDARSDYAAAKARVLGVSPDDVKSHRKFADKYQLPFTLFADPDHKVCEKYGVWKEKSMYGRTYMGVERTTIVIGPDGKIRKIFPKVKVDGHSEEVLEAIRSAAV